MKLHLLIIILAASAYLCFGQTAPPSPITPKDETPIKVNTLLLNIPVVASDAQGRSIAGLTKDNFIVTEDGVRQPIEFFADSEAPVTVAIMIDTSGSTLPIINRIKNAAKAFIKVLRPEDQAVIVSFDGQTSFLSELTANHKELNSGVDKAGLVQPLGTSMYDAIYDVVKNRFALVQGRKAIILLTDGGEFGSQITGKELFFALANADTVIYPILFEVDGGLPPPIFAPKITLPNGQKVTEEQFLVIRQNQRVGFMQALGSLTGGRFFESQPKKFAETFQLIADELKKQYLLGFYPQNLDDGKAHRVDVEVTPSNIVVRTKRVIQLN